MRSVPSLMAVTLLLMFGCGTSEDGGGGGTVTADPPGKAPPREVVPPTEAAGPVVDDPRFTITASGEASYTQGELGRFGIRIASKEGWHVNQEYPTRITLTPAEGITLPRAELEKSDAAEFGDDVARFDVPFTPGQAGEGRCAAYVDFAICTDETCIPVQHTVAVVLPVH
jgi:DsbC/DsbD-like thiol-disulfide interchange protein